MTTTAPAPHRITPVTGGFVSTVQTPDGKWETARYDEASDDFTIISTVGRAAVALVHHNRAIGR